MKSFLILFMVLAGQISFAQRGTGDTGSAEVPTSNSVIEKFRNEIEGKKLRLSEKLGTASCENEIILKADTDANEIYTIKSDNIYSFRHRNEFTLPLRVEENSQLRNDCQIATSGLLRARVCTQVSQKMNNNSLVTEQVWEETGFFPIVRTKKYVSKLSISYDSSINTVRLSEVQGDTPDKHCIYAQLED